MTGSKDFSIKIGPQMQKGIFAVIPSKGVSGITSFTIKVSNWEVLGLENIISYDIFFYLEDTQYQKQLDVTLTKRKFYQELFRA
jgi:hypothetical protein